MQVLTFFSPLRPKSTSSCPPAGITISVEANTKITVTGSNKQAVGDVAAEIRGKRPPEVYKGKGVRYEGEYVRRKAGKTGKK